MINIPQEIQTDLRQIEVVANDLKMKAYVVGGFPRDIVMGIEITNESDLDLTEANGNAFDLAFFVAAKYNLPEPQIYELSGTAMIIMPSGRMIEFHNAYHNVSHIIDQLYVMGVEPTPINKDVFSRDFTINTLLFDIETQEIIDLTGKGIEDIRNRYLRTPLTPAKTLAIEPKRLLRGMRFEVQFDMRVDPAYEKEIPNFLPYLVSFMQTHPDSKMVRATVEKTFQANPQKALEEFKKWDLIKFLPKTDEMDKVLKGDLFGMSVTPAASSYFDPIKTAQTRMIQYLMQEREKHKAYMRRKRREEAQKREEKFDILEKAKTGYYTNNPLDGINLPKKKNRGYENVAG